MGHTPVGRRVRRLVQSRFERKPNLQRHLPVRDLAFLDMAARVNDFEPADVAHRFRRFRDGAIDRVFDAGRGAAGQLYINVGAHGIPPAV